MTIKERVIEIIVEQLGVKPEQVNTDAEFVDDLGADSLDTVELKKRYHFQKCQVGNKRHVCMGLGF